MILMSLWGRGLRYSQVAPNQRIFIQIRYRGSAATWEPTEEARWGIDQIIANELVNRKWFDARWFRRVPFSTGNYKSNADLEILGSSIIRPSSSVNFSDPEDQQKDWRDGKNRCLFWLSNVDYWNYTMENKDKIAKVGMGINMVDANTGQDPLEGESSYHRRLLDH